jgi:hypothetical protein
VDNTAQLKKPTLKRRTWTRYHHELLNQPLWRRVARLAGAPIERVEAMVTRLEVHASSSTPTGLVEDFDCASLAAHWNLPSDEPVGRIYAALETVGWIEQGHVATYWSRNPDGEAEELERRRALDAERQRKRYAKLKAEKEIARAKYTSPHSREAHVRSVRLTTRSDQIIKQEGGAVDNSGAVDRGEAAGLPSKEFAAAPAASAAPVAGSDIASPTLWLSIEGNRIVTERLLIQPLVASTKIERWKRDLAGDETALVEVLRSGHALVAPHADFGRWVDAQIHNVVDERAHGRQLGLMPPRPQRRESG